MNTSFVYSIEDVAKEIGIPFINTRPKMFKFLRRYGIIEEHLPLPELVCKELFTVEFRHIKQAGKTVPVIKVSKKGLIFIKRLAILIFE